MLIQKGVSLILVGIFLMGAVRITAAVEPRERGNDDGNGRTRGGGEAIAGRDGAPAEGYEEGVAPQGDAAKIAPADRFRLPGRWRLGVYAYNTRAGAVITRVVENTPAAAAGLEAGDVIVTVKGFQVGYVDDRAYNLGDELQLRAGPEGRVRLLVHDVRGRGNVVTPVHLERFPQPVPLPRDRDRGN